MQQIDTLGSRAATFHLQEGCLSTVKEINPFCSYFSQPSRRIRQRPPPRVRHFIQQKTGRASAWRTQVGPPGHFLEETETGGHWRMDNPSRHELCPLQPLCPQLRRVSSCHDQQTILRVHGFLWETFLILSSLRSQREPSFPQQPHLYFPWQKTKTPPAPSNPSSPRKLLEVGRKALISNILSKEKVGNGFSSASKKMSLSCLSPSYSFSSWQVRSLSSLLIPHSRGIVLLPFQVPGKPDTNFGNPKFPRSKGIMQCRYKIGFTGGKFISRKAAEYM